MDTNVTITMTMTITMIVKSPTIFLDKVNSLKVSHPPPPPWSDERAQMPPPDVASRKRLVLIYNNQSIFNTNEGQTDIWVTEDTLVIQLKTKGAGVMVSDFIDQDRVAIYWGYSNSTKSRHSKVSTGIVWIWSREARLLNSREILKEYQRCRSYYRIGLLSGQPHSCVVIWPIQLPQSICRWCHKCTSYECLTRGESASNKGYCLAHHLTLSHLHF